MNSFNNSVIFLAVLIFTTPFITSAEDDCPDPFECSTCNVIWRYPEITEEQKYVNEDHCTVTLHWEWPFTSPADGNPRMTFLCYYDNNEGCNVGEEVVCASCESITLYRLNPSRNPVVNFTDTCGNEEYFRVAESCAPTSNTPAPTTNIHTTIGTSDSPVEMTSDSPSETTTTKISTEPSTTNILTTDLSVAATDATQVSNTSETSPADTTSSPIIFTTDSPSASTPGHSCPPQSECDSCPFDWEIPDITETTVQIGNDTCDVHLSWDTDLSSANGSPRMSFTCYYGETGEYCSSKADILCSSCGNLTLRNISSHLHPYVSYTDNCGFSTQSIIASECYTPPPLTTPPPDATCPNPLNCYGCDSETWTSPKLNVTTGPLVNDSCNVYISWDWNYTPVTDYPNPRFTFQCIYENGEFCDGDHFKAACGSCQEIVFENLNNELDPYINFSDTCGDLFRLNIPDCQLV